METDWNEVELNMAKKTKTFNEEKTKADFSIVTKTYRGDPEFKLVASLGKETCESKIIDSCQVFDMNGNEKVVHSSEDSSALSIKSSEFESLPDYPKIIIGATVFY